MRTCLCSAFGNWYVVCFFFCLWFQDSPCLWMNKNLQLWIPRFVLTSSRSTVRAAPQRSRRSRGGIPSRGRTRDQSHDPDQWVNDPRAHKPPPVTVADPTTSPQHITWEPVQTRCGSRGHLRPRVDRRTRGASG